MRNFLFIILALFSLTMGSIFFIKKVQLNQNCTGYLKRAADANTVELADKELSRAITYLEENNLTSGYTSVLYRTPDEDISFWYNNLKQAQNELREVKNSPSTLETSNVLIKLRETLMEHGDKGDKLTVPEGLSRYPNNLLFGILNIIAFASAFSLLCFLNIEIKKL